MGKLIVLLAIIYIVLKMINTNAKLRERDARRAAEEEQRRLEAEEAEDEELTRMEAVDVEADVIEDDDDSKVIEVETVEVE